MFLKDTIDLKQEAIKSDKRFQQNFRIQKSILFLYINKDKIFIHNSFKNNKISKNKPNQLFDKSTDRVKNLKILEKESQ